MSISWEKVLTDPLGLAGYALFLIFGVVTFVVKQRNPKNRWVVFAGIALGAVCVLGGLALSYRREPVRSAPTPSMHIDKVQQKVVDGNAVAGVQGQVTINSSLPPSASKPQR